MKKTIKKLIFVLIALGIICAIMPIGVKAALQSNGDTPTQANVNDWMWNIRQMQATGQTLGLTDTINTTNLTSGNKNLDIHMQKNTEYGAMILLGVSQYGNPNKLNTNGVTTTGNKTGIVLNINKEWVAGVTSSIVATNVKNASARYKNIYTTSYVEKKGDAIATVGNWHGSTGNTWLNAGGSIAEAAKYSALVRANSGSSFSFYGIGNNGGSIELMQANYNRNVTSGGTIQDAWILKPYASRAAVVVGSGV